MYNKEQMAKIYDLIDSLAPGKFEGACIYSISINNKIIYIGKSMDTRHRIASHICNIDFQGSDYKAHKYEIMRQAKQAGYKIKFDVLYKSQKNQTQEIEEDIGKQEGIFIRKYTPLLNYQIPKEEDWHKFTVNKKASKITLEEVLAPLN